jgi:hypothetical protein
VRSLLPCSLHLALSERALLNANLVDTPRRSLLPREARSELASSI